MEVAAAMEAMAAAAEAAAATVAATGAAVEAEVAAAETMTAAALVGVVLEVMAPCASFRVPPFFWVSCLDAATSDN